MDERRLPAYAEPVEGIAGTDIAFVPAEQDIGVRHVVLGTVLVDPVLAVLRRLAQQHLSIGELEGRDPQVRTREETGRNPQKARGEGGER